jgi:hypothetical protein
MRTGIEGLACIVPSDNSEELSDRLYQNCRRGRSAQQNSDLLITELTELTQKINYFTTRK